MDILKLPTSFLNFTGRNTAFLALTVITLFIEVCHQLLMGNSLIHKDANLESLLDFRILFGFVLFVSIGKLVFFYYYIIMSQIFKNIIHKIDIANSYNLSLGCFLVGFLAIAHGIGTNESNDFSCYIGSHNYMVGFTFVGVLLALFSSLCNWESDENQK